MILVPEIETVVLLTPKVASGSLKTALLTRYPRATLLYRHMEADGVPHGYDRWEKVGVVREPVARLWSLYKFLADFDGPYNPEYVEAQRASVRMSFSDWLVGNQVVFTSPYDTSGGERFFPGYACMHPVPENRKSQFLYLRPDLGTRIYRYDELSALEHRLGVKLGVTHQTAREPYPTLTMAAREHITRFFTWDCIAAAPARER